MRNKNILIAAAFGIATVLSISVTAQKRMLEIYQNGKVSHSVEVADIDSIKINSKLQAPPTVEATVTDKGIVVKWTAVEGATDYDVFRSPDNTAYTAIEENVNGTSYTDKSPFSGINYYKVRANGSDGLTSPLSNASSPVSTSGAIAGTGLYMGIIGFNQELTSKEISILAPNTKTAFTGFVSGLTSKNGTLLYYAVDNAIDKLSAAILPDDLVNVSIVTFTDGLDQGSMMMNPDYASDSEYLSALNERIGSVKVHGLPITAYSIGLKGNDVTDENKFMENLQNLASAPENAAEVSSMEEVNAKFQEIAEQLYNISSSQTINLKIPGQSNGTVIRFTFDDVADAAQSEIYIEGTFSLQDRTLKEITYQGLSCSSGATVTGTQDGIFVTFSFTDLKQTTGDAVPTNFIKQWSYLPSTSQWQINSEFTPEDNTVTTVDRKSAVIMLVLDCSSSLGSQFSNMQTHANQFIEKMAENTEPTTTKHYNFENAERGSKNFIDFTTIDVDNKATLDFSSLNFPEMGTQFAFLAVSDNDWYNYINPTSGRMFLLAAAPNDGSDSDDWIISKKLKATNSSKFSFHARNYESVNSISPKNRSQIEVLVSTTSNTSTVYFETIMKRTELSYYNGEWEYFEIDLSAYDGQEIYVALRHYAHNGMAAMFDDFTLSNFYEL